MSETRKPWEHAKGGGSEHDDLAARFVESLSYDTRLYKHDIAGSIAHARMLEHVGLITADDLSAIERGLGAIEREIDEQGEKWPGWKVELEDVHMCIEAALIEKIGDPGRKLHTGRSRNDQVATDLTLWCKDAGYEISDRLHTLCLSLLSIADRYGDIVIPSYTHLQRAQPVTVGGELLAWAEAFSRSGDRLCDVSCLSLRSPLGAGAIAGSSLPLNREHVNDALKLVEPTLSAMDSTASRDVAIDFVYALSMTAMWLSRWAEQWIIYMTSEFRMLKIGEAYTTGSSMMPQKRNPDMLELIRGRCGGVYGHLVALLTMCKGLTIGYNRDLQEDKRHVFAAYDTVKDCLEMATRIVRSAKFTSPDMTRGFMDATSLAEYLVTKGVPFRTAHQHVGALVRLCEEKKLIQLSDLTLDDMKAVCDVIEADVADWLGAENVVQRYQTYGNAGLSGYRQQLKLWRERLAEAQRHAGTEAPREGGDEGLFGEDVGVHEGDAVLIGAYEKRGRTLDDLPYTQEFEAIYGEAGEGRSRREVLARLLNLRKAGKLPRIGRAKEPPPHVTDEQEAVLRELVEAEVEAMSHRDQLPHTEAFERIVSAFNAATDLTLSPHQVWRVVAKLAK